MDAKQFLKQLMFLIAGVILTMSSASVARAQTVITSSTCDISDFQTALDNGGLITFSSDCTIVLGKISAFELTKDVAIDGAGHQVILDGGGMSHGLLFNDKGFTLTVNHLTLQNNARSSAIYSAPGTLIVTNCTFLNNTTGDGDSGGAISASGPGGSLTVLNSTFSGNQVNGQFSVGGAIFSDGVTTTIINSTFYGNSAPSGTGGGIESSNGTVTLIDTILAGNSGGNCAVGGLHTLGTFTDGGYNLADDNTCGFSATGSQNNDANIKLGTLSNGVIPPISGSDAIDAIPAGTNGCATTVITDQIGQARPGSLDGKCTVGAYEVVAPVSATITDCSSDTQLQTAVNSGGRIVFGCSGDIPLSGTLNINQNTAIDATGQILTLDGHNSVEVLNVNSGVLTLNNVTVARGNTGLGVGLNFTNFCTAVVSNSTFTGNSSGLGGGISTGQFTNLIVASSTFSGNSTGEGGAISASGSLTITNSTFVNNSAQFDGGAIHHDGTLFMLNGTFSSNTAPTGGAISGDAPATLKNTLLVSNGGGDCVAGKSNPITDGGYNLDDDGSCGFTSANSLSDNKNGNRGPLSNNGGPTLTIPLLSGSAAIDAIPLLANGCGTTILTDQRGVLRPQGSACDIGAFENALNQVQITFNTAPAGPSYTAGASSYTGQQILTLPAATQLTLWVPSPQTSPGVQYSFANWSDGGAQAHTITILGSTTTYTANFNAAYQLTTAVNPSGDGSVSPASGSYYAAGSPVQLTATPNTGYVFTGWTGTVTSASNPLTLTMNSPVTETANFAKLIGFTITPNPPAETIYRGDIAAFILTLKSVNGFSGNVKLSCSGGPTGSYCVDFPMTVHLKGAAYAISGILFPKNTKPGTYTIVFAGVSGTATNTASANFTLK